MSGRRAKWLRRVFVPVAGRAGYRALKRQYARDLVQTSPSRARGPRIAGTFTRARTGGAA